jgi:hypothetical protein
MGMIKMLSGDMHGKSCNGCVKHSYKKCTDA